jgi:hypothetical protein
MTSRVEASRRHGPFDLRWPARRQASDRPRPAAPGRKHVPDGLAWGAFSTRCFPGAVGMTSTQSARTRYTARFRTRFVLDDPRLERLTKREIDDELAGARSVLQIPCECGRSACAEVIALQWSVYEQAKREPRRSLLVPGHELPRIGRALSRCDSFVVVANE